jgi:hypothetical protein
MVQDLVDGLARTIDSTDLHATLFTPVGDQFNADDNLHELPRHGYRGAEILARSPENPQLLNTPNVLEQWQQRLGRITQGHWGACRRTRASSGIVPASNDLALLRDVDCMHPGSGLELAINVLDVSFHGVRRDKEMLTNLDDA